MNVVHIKDWQHRRPRQTIARPLATPPTHLRLVGSAPNVDAAILPPGADLHDTQAAEDARLRMRQNLAAVAFVVTIVALSGWLISQLQASSRIQACFDYGHRNCMPLNLGQTASPTARPQP